MSTADRDDERPPAVRHAETGAAGWEAAARAQLRAEPDHADFYALAREIVATLQAIDDVAQVMGRQVADYADTQQAQGRVVYDDTRQVNSRVRLVEAVESLADTRDALSRATRAANTFWSGIGHIGVEDVTS